MIMAKSLRTFLDDMRRTYPAEVVSISKRVYPLTYDVTAIVKKLGALKRFPVLVFEQDPRKTSVIIVDATKPLDRPFSPVSKCPDEALVRIKLEEYVPGEVLQYIPIDRTTYWA
jgi:hypothetical protein